MKEEPKDFDEGEGGVGEGDEGDDADGVGQVLLILIHLYLTRRIVLGIVLFLQHSSAVG